MAVVAQNGVQQSCKIRLSSGACTILRGGAAEAANPNSGAPCVFGGFHVRFAISDEKCPTRVDAGKPASGKYHSRGRFAALTVLIRTVRTIEGGRDAAAVLLNVPNDTFMNLPEIVPADQPPADTGLVAHQNDSRAAAPEKPQGFESVRIKADFLKVLYVIGAVFIQYAVPVQKEEPAVAGLWRIKPYNHSYGPASNQSEYAQIVPVIYYNKEDGVQSRKLLKSYNVVTFFVFNA